MSGLRKNLRSHFWGEATTKIIEIIGEDEKALAFFRTFGGQERCYVPKRLRPDHPWRAVLGDEALARLSREFGGCRVDIPLASASCAEKVLIAEAILQNTESRRAIARRFGRSERGIRQLAQQLRNLGFDVPKPPVRRPRKELSTNE
ncbi:helix-turn-helix domain-containing protein [Rhodothalassium salexigens]|uniref:helix-turn-helix domain-containing protein n=1 Tax=Rhodothalassium salexigens TaxID=1086 RepID=UPI001914C6D2|nr:helix-turn-helix domain-containing protein [Rhodothalassium salexigens]